MKKDIPSDFDEAKFYQKIGEFVVSFQWTEHLFRQIGWFCIDPTMGGLSDEELRNESNHELLNKVLVHHDDFIQRYGINEKIGYQLDFALTIQTFHNYRKFRNNLLHSAYVELKAGGEVMALLRSNPKIKKDPLTKDAIYDMDIITADDISEVMARFSADVFHLSLYFTQLKHWYWAARDRLKK